MNETLAEEYRSNHSQLLVSPRQGLRNRAFIRGSPIPSNICKYPNNTGETKVMQHNLKEYQYDTATSSGSFKVVKHMPYQLSHPGFTNQPPIILHLYSRTGVLYCAECEGYVCRAPLYWLQSFSTTRRTVLAPANAQQGVGWTLFLAKIKISDQFSCMIRVTHTEFR